MADAVRTASYDIIPGKIYTSSASLSCAFAMRFLRDERAMLPVSTLLTSEFGIPDVCFNLPCILGAGSSERIFVPEITDTETAGLKASARVLKDALAVWMVFHSYDNGGAYCSDALAELALTTSRTELITTRRKRIPMLLCCEHGE